MAAPTISRDKVLQLGRLRCQMSHRTPGRSDAIRIHVYNLSEITHEYCGRLYFYTRSASRLFLTGFPGMTSIDGFVAYPSRPIEIGQTMGAALGVAHERFGTGILESWEENDIAGRFIAEPILDKISSANVLVADVTRLNFNVTFEIGFAIGRKKRLLLTNNSAIVSDRQLMQDVGIYDTLGYRTYTTSEELAAFLASVQDLRPIQFDTTNNRKSPVYLVLPPTHTDIELRIAARIKKARLGFRQFDPAEAGRLPAPEAIRHVASSIRCGRAFTCFESC